MGAASISLYAVLVAIVLGATSLYRELDLKTVFPILTRRLSRGEYVVGKYLGTLLTLATFVALDISAVFLVLGVESGVGIKVCATWGAALLAALAVLMLLAPLHRVFVVLPWSVVAAIATYLLSAPAGAERQLVAASALLTLAEVGIIAAVATFFSSFSSPFLTAIFTLAIFLVGRSAETLAHLPPRMVGETIAETGAVVARVMPNLHIYVPPRPLLLGLVEGTPLWLFVGKASLHAGAYAMVLLGLSVTIFKRRDFQ
jgi:ABC-type transport system involved in multi-copper enzyme maturation permease subunit